MGQAVVFADETGEEVGHVLYDPLGAVVTNTLPVTLTEPLLAGRLDTGLELHHSVRGWYDLQVAGFLQPGVGTGLAGGDGEPPPLLVEAGKSTVSNSAGAWLGDRLEPIPGRVVGSIGVGNWQRLRISVASFARPRYYAHSMAEFFHHRVEFGPLRLHHTNEARNFHKLVVRRLPDNADSLARSLNRNGVWVGWEPFVNPRFGRVWNYSFGLNSKLASHFTAGSFSAGAVADIVVGGVWQGVEDYDLWARDPGLAFGRASTAAGVNATVGIAGALTAGGIAWGLATFASFTPPGQAVLVGGIIITVGYDIWWGDDLKEWSFTKFDLNLPEEKHHQSNR